MEQAERRIYLIKALLAERPERYEGVKVPQETSRQRLLLRALLNVRPPEPVSGAFLRVQDAYLREELARKGMPEPYEKVLEELIRRDEIDTHRAASPLRKAEDAVEVDCSRMTLEEVVQKVSSLAQQVLEAKA